MEGKGHARERGGRGKGEREEKREGGENGEGGEGHLQKSALMMQITTTLIPRDKFSYVQTYLLIYISVCLLALAVTRQYPL